MNAMVLNTQFSTVEKICSLHRVNLVWTPGGEICPECAKQIVSNNNQEHYKQVNSMMREKHFASSMLPKLHENSGFKNYLTPLPAQVQVRNQVVEFAKSMTRREVSNLVMVGSTGTGKTHLSCATARTIMAKGLHARYITSEYLADEIVEARKRDDSERNVIQRYTEYDLLILDEYGLHDREAWRLEKVHRVLYSRYDANKSTMIVSNMTLQELRNDLGDRLWSRLNHKGLAVVTCNWADARMDGVA